MCMNKMDDTTVMYGEARYKEIKQEVSGYLKKVGYKPRRSCSSRSRAGLATT